MKVLRLKSRNIVVNRNDDGTLTLTRNGKRIDNAGSIIVSLGGINGVLARCEDLTEDELTAIEALRKQQQREKIERIQQRSQKEEERASADYKYVFSGCGVVDSTPRNIGILLNYLNTMSCGQWTLPTMSIGYQCNQYDCDGKMVTTIKLDKSINYRGARISKFKTTSPRGHLDGYCTINNF